jgi:phage shock protein PspC (stress-responsive transcriptional regulator)
MKTTAGGWIMSEKYKYLKRPVKDRIIGGVCAGLGEYFGIHPNWFRIAFMISLLPGGLPGIGLYLVMWIMIPGEQN